MALSPRRWTTEQALSMIGDDVQGEIDAGISHIKAAFAPVPLDSDGRSAWATAMDDRLRRLALKIAPSMPPEQGDPWRVVMVDALADLPAMIALTAAKRALHRPMNFLNEVEGIVREIADVIVTERHAAIGRLLDLQRDLERPPVPALPPQAEAAPLSLEEIRKMPGWLRKTGLEAGIISQAELDEADAAVAATTGE